MTSAAQRSIPWLLGIAILVPLVALGWLGVRMLQQDHDLERQRRQEELQIDAARLALSIERELVDLEARLAQGHGVRLTVSGPEPESGDGLLYGPALPVSSGAAPPAIVAAEQLEYRKRDLDAAAVAYRTLSSSSNAAIRGAALIRLSRVLRKQGDRAAALQAYDALERLGTQPIDGQPAELLARQGRCRVLEESGAAGLREEASRLGQRLYSGVWHIDRPTFDFYAEAVRRWTGQDPPPESIARTETALSLWHSWRSGDLAPRGREVFPGAVPVLAIWAGGPDHPTAWLAAPKDFAALPAALGHSRNLRVAFDDLAGRPFLGPHPEPALVLSPAETHLPFLLRVASSSPEQTSSAGYRLRVSLLTGGLLATFALILVAGYGLYRATTRELAVARMQSDFVSAVSHEFRTPLTSMRHLTDLLVSRGVASEARRAQYYELLSHETKRLQRMVESLLSFGRIEAGGYAWRLENVDLPGLARDVVEEFRREPDSEERDITLDAGIAIPPVCVDREAVSRALWNLLENAAKYSAASDPIRVCTSSAGREVLLAVADRGPGIPAGEREKVFQKFVRGSGATAAGVRGVGIGLTLVRRIMEAHGGSVRLQTELGRGSTFTLVLPCQES